MRSVPLSASASTLIDGVWLLSVVAGLCTVHLGCPPALHTDLVFRYGNPTPLTAWTATLVHDSARHLAATLLGYLGVVGPTYLLYPKWGAVGGSGCSRWG